jgi:nitrite reductase (NADH) large subunit
MPAEPVLCRCLRVTEEEVIRSIRTLGLRTLKEVRDCTGAGGGCMCCHKALSKCLQSHALTSPASTAGPVAA